MTDKHRTVVLVEEDRLLQALDELFERVLLSLEARLRGFGDSTPREVPAETEALLTVHDLAELLKCDPRTVRRLELSGEVPHGIRIGGSKRWHAAAVRRWLEEIQASTDPGTSR